MGIPANERRAVHVDESTWRKAKILAAAFGVPIYAIVTQAINEMAENHQSELLLMMKEVTDERVPRKGESRRSRTRG
jgi:hypothetical protein